MRPLSRTASWSLGLPALAAASALAFFAHGCVITSDTGLAPSSPAASCIARADVVDAGSSRPRFCDLPGNDVPGLVVPEGFCSREYTTTPLHEARVLAFAPNGDLFVSAPRMLTSGDVSGGPGGIFVLADDDHDGRADSATAFDPGSSNGADAGPDVQCAELEKDPANLDCVHGLLFQSGYLYFTRSDEIRRVAYAPGDRAVRGASEVVAKLGGAGHTEVRWTHTLAPRPGGGMLVSRGRSDAFTCDDQDMTLGAIFAVPTESGGALPLVPELVADGLRNPMFVRCSPGCGGCYASELSGDNWGGIGGHEKLISIEAGGHWGFPCCVAHDKPVPGVDPAKCAGVSVELASVELHDTPFGLDFERGTFPAPYTHGVFVALHGAAASWKGTALEWIPTDATTEKPAGSLAPFATGWGMGGPLVGRATDVVFAPDGRLFVSDDAGGHIVWIAPRTLAMP